MSAENMVYRRFARLHWQGDLSTSLARRRLGQIRGKSGRRRGGMGSAEAYCLRSAVLCFADADADANANVEQPALAGGESLPHAGHTRRR